MSIDLAKIRSNEDGQQGLEPLFSDQDTDIGESCKENTKHNIILRKKQSNYNIAAMKKVDG